MPDALALIFSVHVRLDESETVIVVVPAPPSLPTSATSSEPDGGVNDAVVTVVALVVDTTAGAEPSSVRVPFCSTSSTAAPPDLPFVAPIDVAPGELVVAVALNVPYRSPFVASAMLSISVVLPLAVSDEFCPIVHAP